MTLDELLAADMPWPEKRDQLVRWPYVVAERPKVDSWAESQRAMVQGLPDIDETGTFHEVVAAADAGIITRGQLYEVADARAARRS